MSDPSESTPDDWRGIHLTRSMRLQIPAHSITMSVGDDGEVQMSMGALNVSIDLFMHWLEIAVGHVAEAEDAHVQLVHAWDVDDDSRKGAALERDFVHSMQAVVAAGIAIDAFYAMVRQFVEVPDETLAAWQKNRTSRPRQVAEVLRIAFKIGPKSAAGMRKHIRELYKWRDWAVHPQAGFAAPVRYDELKVATEWRFVAFQASNAKGAMGIALSIIAQLLPRARDKYPRLVEHCNGAVQFTSPLVEAWELKYGELYSREGLDDASAADPGVGQPAADDPT